MDKSNENMNQNQLEEQRKIKQGFLRKEIVDVGYDPYIFQNYLDSMRKEGGSNVDQWEIAELIEVVKNYKANFWNSEEKPEKIDKSIEDFNDFDNEIEVKNPVLERKSTDSINELPQNSYRNTIICKKKQIFFEGKDGFSIEIKGYKTVAGGLFSSPHINYLICTLPLGWEVERRFSDFNWLRSTLLKLYPQHILPPLPSKKSNQKHDIQNDDKRKRFLEEFLNNLIKCEELRNTKIVIDFLNIVDISTYKIKKKEADKRVRFTKLEENETILGKLNLLIDRDSIQMLNKLPNFLTDAEAIYKKIKKTSKQLILDYNQMSNTLLALGESFTKLFEINVRLNSGIEKKVNYLDKVYVTLNNLFISWGQNLSDQTTIIQKNLCEFFKYQKKEYNTFREILKNRQTVNQDFINFSGKLQSKKEKIYQLNDITKWELDTSKIPINVDKTQFFVNLKKNKEEAFKYMFYKETIIETELKDNFAYFNNQTYEEVSRCIHQKFMQYCQHFVNFSALQSDFLSEMHLLWADVNSSLSSELKEGNSGLIVSQSFSMNDSKPKDKEPPEKK